MKLSLSSKIKTTETINLHVTPNGEFLISTIFKVKNSKPARLIFLPMKIAALPVARMAQ
jgi:hypothetical protein